MLKRELIFALTVITILLTGCPNTPSGGGGGPVIVPEQDGVLEGKVTFSDGKPAGSTTIHLARVNSGKTAAIRSTLAGRLSPAVSSVSSEEFWWRTDKDGNYRIVGITPGTYSLQANLKDTQGAAYTDIVITGGKKTNLNITLTATGSISGKVTLESTGLNKPGTIVYAAGLSYRAFPADDGTFKIEGIPVGSYNICFSRDNYLTKIQEAVAVNAAQDTVLPAETLSLEPLRIVSSSKKEGSIYASLDRKMQVYFNKNIDPASLAASSVKIFKGTEELKVGEVIAETNFIQFNIGDYLRYNSDYTVKVSGISSYEGNSLAGEQTISFRTHGGPPQILKVTPAPDSSNIPLDTIFTIQFDREMDVRTFSNNIFIGSNNSSQNRIKALLSYDRMTNILTITPEDLLRSGTDYALIIWRNDVKDINGIDLNDNENISNDFSYNANYKSSPFDITGTAGTVHELNIERYGCKYLSFDVTAGITYEIVLDDLKEGSGKYTIDAELGDRDSGSTSYFSSSDSAFSSPVKFTAKKTEKYIFYIRNRDSKAGSCAVLFR